MTAANRLRGLGWFAACVAIALTFYLVSLGVAAERGRLAAKEAQILQARRDLRRLETEFQTRANLAQLERWNGEVLALAAPRAEQFVASVGELASLTPGRGAPVVQLASVVVPMGPPSLVPEERSDAVDAAPSQPVLAHTVIKPAPPRATLPPPAVAEVKARAAAAPAAPSGRSALAGVAAGKPAIVRTAAAPAAKPAVTPRAQAVAMLEERLLSDSTMGDLMSGARAETASRR